MPHANSLKENKPAEILRDFELIRSRRGNFESHWREIAERILPNDSHLFEARNHVTTKGEIRTEELFDATAMVALDRFGSILDSLLTPRNQKWHRLKASLPELNKARDVSLWFDEVTNLLFKYRYLPQANFAAQNQQNYISLGAYGTGAMFIDRLRPGPGIVGTGIRYKSVPLAEVFFRENHQGIIDTAYRNFQMTARQIKQRWPDTMPSKVSKILEKDPDREFFIIHCVRPRENFDPDRLDFLNMPIESTYVMEEGQTLLSEGGFSSFPYAISRYTQSPGEVYGRSPAMNVLPAIKTLNEEKKTVLKQGHRAVDPVLLVHDDGVVDAFSMRPGAMNTGGVTADGRPLVHALPVGNIAIGKDLMDDERNIINDAFLVTLFKILVDSPVVSATEVLERAKEKGILLAPTIGRQQSEYLGPTIIREIEILSDQGLIPPMPPALIEAQGEFEITYDSPLSRAQRAEEAAGAVRTIEIALNIASQTGDPSIMDHFNFDELIPDIASIQGMPVRWTSSVARLTQIRDAREQRAQIDQAIQAAPGAAAMVNAGTQVAKAG